MSPEDTKANDYEVETQKNYMVNLLKSNHASSVYYTGCVLPVIMAKVPGVELKR